jgi:APA family basic amino acid/polyamine antiporter
VVVPLAFLGSFDKLLAYVMFTDSLSLVVVAACLFVLRRRREGESDPETWRMPGYPWLPLGFVVVLLGVAAAVLMREPRVALGGSAVVLAGIPLYAAIRGITARSR